MADQSYMTLTSIDLILGADVYADLILPGLITGPPVTPIAQSTIFGWILSGPIGRTYDNNCISMYYCVSHEADKLITQFWVQEEIMNVEEPTVSTENHACEEFLKSNVQGTEHGHYEVRLPLKESAENLGESFRPP